MRPGTALLRAFKGASSTPYRDAVLADAPAIYYRCNETSGTTVTDIGSAGLNATIVGSAPDANLITSAGLLTSESDAGFLLPATGVTSIQRLNAAGMPATNANWTIEFIIKPTGTPSGPGASGTIIQFRGVGGSAGAPEINIKETTAGTKFKLRVMRASVAELFRSTTEYSYNTRLHCVLGYTAATGALALAINNIDDGSATFTFGAFTGTTYIGYDGRNNNYPFKGYLDEVAIYSSLLTATQRGNHYAAM